MRSWPASRSLKPDRRIIDVTETDGYDATIRGVDLAALAAEAAVPAVYSIGGGNTAILDAFADAGRPAPVHRARSRRRQRPAAARRPHRCRAPPRPEAGHAPGLPGHHVGAEGAAGLPGNRVRD